MSGGGRDPARDAVHIHTHVRAGYRLHYPCDAAARARRTHGGAARDRGRQSDQENSSCHSLVHGRARKTLRREQRTKRRAKRRFLFLRRRASLRFAARGDARRACANSSYFSGRHATYVIMWIYQKLRERMCLRPELQLLVIVVSVAAAQTPVPARPTGGRGKIIHFVNCCLWQAMCTRAAHLQKW